MANFQSDPTLTHFTFMDNLTSVNGGGGGMDNNFSNPLLMNGIITENSSTYGSGINNYASNPILTNVTLSGNSGILGSGMYNSFSNPSMMNVTIIGNSATESGGGLYNVFSSRPNFKNSILWGNTPDQVIDTNESFSTITYSDIQGGWGGTGNINVDPVLLPLTDNGGFTLTYALSPVSPAIDSGDTSGCPTNDQRDFPRPIDGDGDGLAICDMGAYEYEPSWSYLYLPLIVK